MKSAIAAEGLPLSKAVLYDSKYTLEVSGQIGLEDGSLIEGIEGQTRKTLEHIQDILEGVGWDLRNVVKTRVYLADMNHYASMNSVYEGFFKDDPPARVALAVKELPLGALVEIECTAIGDDIRHQKPKPI